MKTFSKRLTKTLIALILAILMVLGTTATSFAAIRNDIAVTGWDTNKLEFHGQVKTSTLGFDSTWQTFNMEGNSKDYYKLTVTVEKSKTVKFKFVDQWNQWLGGGTSKTGTYTGGSYQTYDGMSTSGGDDSFTTPSSADYYICSIQCWTSYDNAWKCRIDMFPCSKTTLHYVSKTYAQYHNRLYAFQDCYGGNAPTGSTISNGTPTAKPNATWGNEPQDSLSDLGISGFTQKWNTRNFYYSPIANKVTSIKTIMHDASGQGYEGTINFSDLDSGELWVVDNSNSYTITKRSSLYTDITNTNYVSAYNGGSNPGYTDASYTAYKTAYEDAATKYSSYDSTQTQIDAAVSALETAYSNLEKTYSVTISAGTGGSVNPSGSQQIGSTPVDITATPGSGYKFSNWSVTGGASVASTTSASTTATATATGTIKANFVSTDVTVTPSTVSNGSWTAGSSTAKTQASGSDFTFTVNPDTGYHLSSASYSGTSGTVSVSGNTITIPNVTSSGNLTATCAIDTFNVTASCSNGTVSPASTTINYGESKEFTVAPASGYELTSDPSFSGTGTVTRNGNTITLSNVTKGGTLTISCTPKTYTLTLDAGTNGGTVSGGATTTKSVTYKSTYGDLPDAVKEGYKFNGWFTSASGGSKVTSSSTYNTADNSTIYAQFTINSYNIRKTQSGGTGTVTLVSSANYNSNVSLDIKAPTNYKVSSIIVTNDTTGGTLSISPTLGENVTHYTGSFTMPSSDVNVAITYASMGECEPVVYPPSASLTIGQTQLFNISKNPYCSEGSSGDFSYSIVSGSENVEITASTVTTCTVKAKKSGSATLRVTCNTDNKYKDVSINVVAPVFTVSNATVGVNGTYNPTPSITSGAPIGTITYEYASSDTSKVTVSGNTITGYAPTTSTKVTATMKVDGSAVATADFYITVSTPVPTITLGKSTLKINETTTAIGDITNASDGKWSYSSSNTNVATINSTSGAITANQSGNSTITATYTVNGLTYSKTASLTVTEPTIYVTLTPSSINIGGKSELTYNITNGPVSGTSTVTYESETTSVATISGTQITGVTPGQSIITVNYTINSKTYKGNAIVTVTAPTFSVTPKTKTILLGQSYTITPNPQGSTTIPNITYSSNSDCVSVSSIGIVTAQSTGTATITATATYGVGGYQLTDTSTVTVNEASISVSPDSLALEYGAGYAGEGTFTVTTPVTDISSTVSCVSGNENVATVSYSDGTATVTATGTGSTDITVTYISGEVEKTATVRVNVTKYDPYYVIYWEDKYNGDSGVTNWGDHQTAIYYWAKSGTLSTGEANAHAFMTYIGNNDQNNARVFAYKIPKADWDNVKVVFHKTGNTRTAVNTVPTWGDNDGLKTKDIDLSGDYSGKNAFYPTGWATTVQVGSYNKEYKLPTVEIDNDTFDVGSKNNEVSAVVTQSDSTSAASDDSLWFVYDDSQYKQSDSHISIASTDKDTAYVDANVATDVLPSTLKIVAFVDKTNVAHLGTLNTNPTNAWEKEEVWEYIATIGTANISVSSVDLAVTTTDMYTVDGSDYTQGNVGGTSTATVDGETVTTVPYGTEVTFTATPSEGYRFVGWFINDELIDDENPHIYTVNADTNMVAKFIKQYSFTLNEVSGITYTGTNAETGTYDAGTSFSITATSADGYKFTSWTATGSPTSGSTDNPITFNILEDSALTANTVRTYLAQATVVTKNSSASGGSVEISGDDCGNHYFTEGSLVTFTASTNTNYSFLGWSLDDGDTIESSNSTYSANMTTDGLNVQAIFVKDYYLIGTLVGGNDFDTNAIKFTYNYENNNYTVGSISSYVATTANEFQIIGGSDWSKYTPEVGTCTGIKCIPIEDGYGSNKYSLSDLDTTRFNNELTIEYSRDENSVVVKASPKDAHTVSISNSGNIKTATFDRTPAEYFPTETFTATFTKQNSEYIIVTDENGVDHTLDGNTYSAQMGEENITLTVNKYQKGHISLSSTYGINTSTTGFGSDAYVIPDGNTVTYTISPLTSDYNIQSVELNGTGSSNFHVGAKTSDGSFVITGTFHNDDDILVTPTVEAQFTINAEIAFIKPIADNDVNANNSTYTKGTTSPVTWNNNSMTTTVTTNDGNLNLNAQYQGNATNRSYTFLGWYKTKTDGKYYDKVSGNSSYSFKPTQNITLYGLFVQDFYVCGDVIGDWGKCQKLSYNPVDHSYYTNVNIPGDYKFVSYPSSDDNTVVNNHTADPTLCNGLTLTAPQGNNSNIVLEGNYGAPITLNMYPYIENAVQKYSEFASATYKAGTVYLSYGRYGVGDFESKSSFVGVSSDDVSGEEIIKKVGTETPAEKYIYYGMNPIDTVTVQTELSGNEASQYKVAAFVMYEKKTGKATSIQTISNMGNNTYAASIPCTSTCYIVPVFEKIGEGTYVTFYSDQVDDWGPMTAVYAYTEVGGGSAIKYNGDWPGQPMIPTNDGISYIAKVPSGAQGVVFNNYMVDSVINTKAKQDISSVDGFDELKNLDSKQTYDYKESTILKAHGYSSIEFDLKKNYDNYHSDQKGQTDGSKTDLFVEEGKDITPSNYTFQDLYARDGSTLMPLTVTGNVNASNDPFYIVSRGDIYNIDDIGQWAVKWFVYSSSGKYLTSVYSNAIYDAVNFESGTKSSLVQALLNNGYTYNEIATSPVRISYELANKGVSKEVLSYDGQWYGNLPTDVMRQSVAVGTYDGIDFTIKDTNPVNIGIYGEAYITNGGQDDQYYDVTYAEPQVKLDARLKSGYKFVGWYTKNTNDEFVKVNEAQKCTLSVAYPETYYAMFQPMGDTELYVTNQIYVNNDSEHDDAILSHNGPADMSVAIYEYSEEAEDHKGNLLSQGDLSRSLSTASVTMSGTNKYYVEISSTPLNQGEFYAFYTDSVTADGRKTFEEVLTRKEDVGKTTKVTNGFIVENIGTALTINIYTDCTKVDNTCTIVYKYVDRFGQIKTYTKRDMPLSDDECKGFDGNSMNGYCPSFLAKFKMVKGDKTQYVFGNELKNTYEEAGWSNTDYEASTVTKHTPTEIQADVKNKILDWDPENASNISISKSIVVLNAVETDPTFTLKYTAGGETKIEEYSYNSLAVLSDVPKESGGQKFAYWVDEDNQIISTYPQYNMRVTRDKEITAVYDDTPDNIWTPLIDEAVVTREISDTSDTVYTDYTVHFSNSLGKQLTPEIMAEDNIVDYGVVVLQGVKGSGDPSDIYPVDDWKGEGQIETVIKKMVGDASTADVRNFSNHLCTRISYVTTNPIYHISSLTVPFNRAIVAMGYDNTGNKAQGYSFSTFSYIKYDDGTVAYSKAANVQLYEQAHD